jgi:membrane peptidoglycan carboxypeptidase/LysM repeat protein
MQLARQLFLGDEQRYDQSFDRKMLELGLAQELTALYSKDEILEMYLNLINYGRLAYGPEAAAQTYFNKHAAELNRAEATFLAGIPQAPAIYNPYTNFAVTRKRQRTVLDLMVRHRVIDEATADRIFDQKLIFQGDFVTPPVKAPQFVQYFERVMNRRLGEGVLRRTGWHIYTTLDLRMQEMAQKMVAAKVAELQPLNDANNAALLAIHPVTGEILTMVGSADYNNDEIAGKVNVIVSQRQPGSAIKPLLYATALDQNVISPASVLFDTPVVYDMGNGSFYEPRNYTGQFYGMVTARFSLANSLNVPTVKLLYKLGLENFLTGAAKLGIRSFTTDTIIGPSIVLGGNEVNMLEMANAYRVLANNGKYQEPEVVVRATDASGLPVKLPMAAAPVQAISEAAAWLTTDIMSDNEARATVFGANSVLKLSRPAAAKTGTTTDYRDNWTMGFTRYLLVGVWVGNTDGHPMRNTTGVTGAAPLWHDFMEGVIAEPWLLAMLGAPMDEAAWAFPPSASVEMMDVCPEGLRCRTGGEYFSDSWMAMTGPAGPLADSFATLPTVSAYTLKPEDNSMVYCERLDGQPRKVLNLGWMAQHTASTPEASEPVTLTLDTLMAQPGLGSFLTQLDDEGNPFIMYYTEQEMERFRGMGWAMQRGFAVSVGSCDNIHHYTVRSGDHWGIIGKKFGISAKDLMRANRPIAREGGLLFAGDQVLVPEGHIVEITGGETYVVQSGDTWSAIANRTKRPLALLKAVNPSMLRPNLLLKPGDKIIIPVSVGS